MEQTESLPTHLPSFAKAPPFSQHWHVRANLLPVAMSNLRKRKIQMQLAYKKRNQANQEINLNINRQNKNPTN